MKKQFEENISSVYSYHDQIEGTDTSYLIKKIINLMIIMIRKMIYLLLKSF